MTELSVVRGKLSVPKSPHFKPAKGEREEIQEEFLASKPLNQSGLPREVYRVLGHISDELTAGGELEEVKKVFQSGGSLEPFRTKTYNQHGKPDVMLESVGVDHLHIPEYPSNKILLAHVCDQFGGHYVRGRVLLLRFGKHPRNEEWVKASAEVADDVLAWHNKAGSCTWGHAPLLFDKSAFGRVWKEPTLSEVWELARHNMQPTITTPKGTRILLGGRTLDGIPIKVHRQVQLLHS